MKIIAPIGMILALIGFIDLMVVAFLILLNVAEFPETESSYRFGVTFALLGILLQLFGKADRTDQK